MGGKKIGSLKTGYEILRIFGGIFEVPTPRKVLPAGAWWNRDASPPVGAWSQPSRCRGRGCCRERWRQSERGDRRRCSDHSAAAILRCFECACLLGCSRVHPQVASGCGASAFSESLGCHRVL